MELKDLKFCVLACVRSHPNRRMTLAQLKDDLFKQNINISELGFNFSDLIQSFSDVLRVTDNGLSTFIEPLQADHISNMNRFSKSKQQQPKAFTNFHQRPDRTLCELDNVHDFSESGSDFDSIYNENCVSNVKMYLPAEEFHRKKDQPSPPDAKNEIALKPTAANDPPTIVKNVLTSSQNSLVSSVQFKPSHEVMKIVVLEVLSPHRFWFAEKSMYKEFLIFQKKLLDFYSTNGEQFKINEEEIKIGMNVATAFKSCWYRVKIVRILEGSSCRVFFIDFGFVEDVEFKNICYLIEEFMDFESVLQRGSLAMIQSKSKFWSDKARKFFKDAVLNKKCDAKIFHKNNKDNSHFLAIKVQNDSSGKLELLVNQMIHRDFGKADKYYMMNDLKLEISFDDYENGLWIDISQAFSLQSCDSWMPNDKVEELPMRHNNVEPREKKLEKIVEEPCVNKPVPQKFRMYRGQNAVTTENLQTKAIPTNVETITNMTTNLNISQTMQRKLQRYKVNRQRFRNGINRDLVLSSSSSSDVVSEQISKQIAAQSVELMTIGREINICIHKVVGSDLFYFFDYEEMDEIKKFLAAFNKCYEAEKTICKRQQISLHSDVVVFNEDSYCRGRVVAAYPNNQYQIFLLDFGSRIVRKSTEIYYLTKDFMHRQAAAYKGSLSIETKQKFNKNEIEVLLQGHQHKRTRAKIMSIEKDGVIKLKLKQ